MFEIKLSQLSSQADRLVKRADRDFKGKRYLIPLHVLEEGVNDQRVVVCRINDIELLEELIEVKYTSRGDRNLKACVDLDTFEKYAKPWEEAAV